jgi:S-adenosylmethionine:tRNA ribosyltransferase-isomerase
VRVDDFDFAFDETLIALHPARPRDGARMLVVPAGERALGDAVVSDLPDWLRPGDALVVNDTEVIAAALTGWRPRDGAAARIEVNLLRALDPWRWQALARPARRLRPGDRIVFGAPGGPCEEAALWATTEARGESGIVTLAFDLSSPELDRRIELIGAPPLPPYIGARRPLEPSDRDDYQTIFAARPGAVAAPTAGLHFTDALLERLEARGVSIHRLTLHVGAGTFLPVKADDTEDHVMHGEWGRIDAPAAAAITEARARGGRVVAVGTTSLRLLEAAADGEGAIAPFAGMTDIFITPGHRFRAVDMLLTNFHLPRSTLFMLVAAFSGLERMKRAYAHAIARRYRFYSYGDACLLERAP